MALQNNNSIKGKIDIEHDYFSGDFLLNDLSRDIANNSINSLDGYNIFNISFNNIIYFLIFSSIQ